MKVRMKLHISGTRNGREWPACGEILEVPDDEGAELCASGNATPVVDDLVETAVGPPEERRSALTTKNGPRARR